MVVMNQMVARKLIWNEGGVGLIAVAIEIIRGDRRTTATFAVEFARPLGALYHAASNYRPQLADSVVKSVREHRRDATDTEVLVV
jgi:hypothetical protein